MGTEQIHMDLIRGSQLHVPVDATAGVPAAGWDLVVDLDGNHVLLTESDIFADIKGEGRVAVCVGAQLLPVDIHGGVHVDTVKVDADLLIPQAVIQREGLAIPADPAWKIAALRLHGFGVFLLDAVIMGQVYTSPGGGVKLRLLRTGGISQIELPIVIEIHGAGARTSVITDIDGLWRRGHLCPRYRCSKGRDRAAQLHCHPQHQCGGERTKHHLVHINTHLSVQPQAIRFAPPAVGNTDRNSLIVYSNCMINGLERQAEFVISTMNILKD